MTPTKESYLKKLQKKRWSRRSFSKRKIPREDLQEIFDSGRQVASSYNEQPWRLILATTDDNHYPQLFECLGEFNQQWCKLAPVLGVALAKTEFSKNNKPNKHCFHDVGAFLAVSALRAVELGYCIHEMAGFSTEEVHRRFNIPEGYEPITMFVLGEPGSKDLLPENLQEEEKNNSGRRPLEAFIFGNTWDEAHNILD